MDIDALTKAMSKLKDGNIASLETVYNLTSRGVFAFVLPIVKDYSLAEDIMQNTYIKIYENIASFKEEMNARNWILTIAKNIAINELNKKTREVPVDIEESSYYEGAYSLDDSLDTPTINLANKILSKEEFDILILYVVGGYKHREIASMLNLPLGTVTWKYNNSLKKIESALKEQNEKEKNRAIAAKRR